MIEQAVILCGGMGTRLGALSAKTPKPLLPVGEIPFLQILIQEIARSGIRRFLLLAGHLADQVREFAQSVSTRLVDGIDVQVSVESGPAGTGGALYEARAQLDDCFLLLNGDSYLDVAIHDLGSLLASHVGAIGVVALRQVADCGRYGAVTLSGSIITAFKEKDSNCGSGLINGGVYLLRREVLTFVTPHCSLERDVLPKIADRGQLIGHQTPGGLFIDIGLPETYKLAQLALVKHRRRPAVFLDRDGVLNLDCGHVGTIDRFVWTDGAIDAISLMNRNGYYVFVVTNQAGIAKAKYNLEAYWHLRDHIRAKLFASSATIDDERFCPYHPDAVDPQWRLASDWRKPEPGMLMDLMRSWPIDKATSFLIGDKLTDLAAARAVGIDGYQFTGGNLREFVQSCLDDQAAKVKSTK